MLTVQSLSKLLVQKFCLRSIASEALVQTILIQKFRGFTPKVWFQNALIRNFRFGSEQFKASWESSVCTRWGLLGRKGRDDLLSSILITFLSFLICWMKLNCSFMNAKCRRIKPLNRRRVSCLGVRSPNRNSANWMALLWSAKFGTQGRLNLLAENRPLTSSFEISKEFIIRMPLCLQGCCWKGESEIPIYSWIGKCNWQVLSHREWVSLRVSLRDNKGWARKKPVI